MWGAVPFRHLVICLFWAELVLQAHGLLLEPALASHLSTAKNHLPFLWKGIAPAPLPCPGSAFAPAPADHGGTD